MDWGLPKLPMYTDRNESAHEYHIYDTYADAMRFVFQVKGVNAR